MVKASRRPRATPPKPPEMYRRPPTAATAWATDSSIGGPTEAWPAERERTGRRLREDTSPTQRYQSERDTEQAAREAEERKDSRGRAGKDRKGQTGPGNQTQTAKPKRGGEIQREKKEQREK